MSLQCQDLKAHLSEHFSLGPITHTFASNSLCAILGHNGAGKSTLFRLLSGLDDPTSGRTLWHQTPVWSQNHDYKRLTGYLPQPLELPLWVSAHDLLHYIARLKEVPHPHSAITAMMDLWQIHPFRYQPIVRCSFGMRKRIALALALLSDPPLLLLDEPLSGLDTYHIRALRTLLRQRSQEGRATIFSTHILTFACEEATSVLLLENGHHRTIEQWPQWNFTTRRAELHALFEQGPTSPSPAPVFPPHSP